MICREKKSITESFIQVDKDFGFFASYSQSPMGDF